MRSTPGLLIVNFPRFSLFLFFIYLGFIVVVVAVVVVVVCLFVCFKEMATTTVDGHCLLCLYF